MRGAVEDLNEEAIDNETPETGGELQALKFPIEFSEGCDAIAIVYVRSFEELDSNETKWESSGWLNGDCLFDESNMATKKQAISDAARAIQHSLAKSRRKADKIACQDVTAFLEYVEVNEDDELVGEPSAWFDSYDADKPQTDVNAGSDAAATESPAEESADDSTKTVETPADEKPTREQVERLNREKNEKAEAAFRLRMSRLGEQLVAAVLRRVDCDEALKRAKACEKTIIDELQDAAERGPEKLPLFDGQQEAEKPAEAAANTQAEQPPTVVEAATNVVADDPDAWRSRPTTELGLPEKLVERLAENGIETIGKLEDLRGSFDGLKSIQGIGQAKADAIEDAVLKWLDKNRDLGMTAKGGE